MKLFLALLTITILSGACKNNQKNTITEKEVDGIIDTKVYAKQIITDTDGIHINTGKLKFKPVTEAKATTLLPKEINGFKLRIMPGLCPFYDENNGVLWAFYDKSASAGFDLLIIDCAGKNVDLTNLDYYKFLKDYVSVLSHKKFNDENFKIKTRSIDFMGGKASVIEDFDTEEDKNSYVLAYVAESRYVIYASSEEGMDIEQLKGVLKNLKLKW
jgi:hypothetical protein